MFSIRVHKRAKMEKERLAKEEEERLKNTKKTPSYMKKTASKANDSFKKQATMTSPQQAPLVAP